MLLVHVDVLYEAIPTCTDNTMFSELNISHHISSHIFNASGSLSRDVSLGLLGICVDVTVIVFNKREIRAH